MLWARKARSYIHPNFQMNTAVNMGIKSITEMKYRHVINHWKGKTIGMTWMTREVKEIIAEKARRIKNYSKFKRPEDLAEANRLRRLVSFMRVETKRGQVHEAYTDFKDGHQQFWKRISELIKPSKSNTTADFLHHLSGERVPESESADYFNEFFANVGQKMSEAMNFDINSNTGTEYQVNIECPPLVIEQDEVRKLVNKIKTTKSSGITSINARVLKHALLGLIPQLTDLYTKSINNCIFPDPWAVSTVVPIPKAGCLREIGNWRPINLLPVPGRMLEKIVHNHVYSLTST